MANNIFKELERGNLAGLKRCISLFPSSVSARNSAGATALHVAAAQGLSAFVKELLVHGAQHDATDSQGNLPLHLAAEQGSLESVTELLTGPGRKLVVKTKNKEGQAPLHLAVRNGHTAVVAKLLDAGARTDAKDKAGLTPMELISPDDKDMMQLLLEATPGHSHANIGQSVSTPSTVRTAEAAHTAHRSPVAGSHAPSASLTTSGRFATPPPLNVGSGGTSRIANATPVTPPGRNTSHGAPAAARGSQGAPVIGTPGALSGRMPRSVGGGQNASPNVSAAPGLSGGGAGVSGGGAGASGASSSVNAQLQKHDAAIQTLRAGLRAATERLGAIDACAGAQLECASQLEKVLEACGSHNRALTDLEARVGFQEERGRDTRGRLERLEEGERSLQDTVLRLAEDQRGLGSQFQKLKEQVAAGSSGPPQRRSADAALATSYPTLQQHQQLNSDMAALRAQVEQLFPALAVATAAGAEARALASRLDALQQQVQQQQQPVNHHQQQALQQTGSAVLLDQQVMQLQAQVQLLQLPVASLTQQCADLSSRLGGLSEWQQQARAELAKLAESVGQAADNRASGGELSEVVMRVLDTTARTMTELRQQQDETAKQVAALLQQQQQQAHGGPPVSPAPPAQPAVPGTPKGTGQRLGSAGDSGSLSNPPSRNLSGQPSIGAMVREAAAHAEMRAELESLKALLADVRKEVASEGGSLRREWQRAFSDMQSRYGEQTNELRAREQNIAKLREAMLVEEAERRAAAGFEEKVSARLSKLETGIEYLTHRLEVLEEQVASMATAATGATSPMVPQSPSRLPSAGTPPHHYQQSSTDARTAPRSGPGPVSENHSALSPLGSARLTAAAVKLASTLGHEGSWAAAGADAGPLAAAGAVCAGGGRLACALDVKDGPFASLPPSSRTDGAAAPSARQPCPYPDDSSSGVLRGSVEDWWHEASAQPSQRSQPSRGVGLGPSPDTSGRERSASATSRSVVAATPRVRQAPPASARSVADQPGAGLLRGGVIAPQPPQGVQLACGLSQPGADTQQMLMQRLQRHPGAALGGSALPSRPDPAGYMALHDPAPFLQGVQPGLGLHQGAEMADHASPLVDPANVVLRAQLLPAAAQSMLAPSVDIQRLAAAAKQQQEQLSKSGLAQETHRKLPLTAEGSPSLQATQVAVAGGGGSVTDARRALAQREAQSPRKEPPLCFFCPVQ